VGSALSRTTGSSKTLCGMLKQTDMKLTIKIIPFFFLVILTSCLAPKAISTIESNDYDDKTNLTTFTKFPFGSISIPGVSFPIIRPFKNRIKLVRGGKRTRMF
jgi:hypothetical protein